MHLILKTSIVRPGLQYRLVLARISVQGAAASRVLIAEVALPQLFAAFPDVDLTETVLWGGLAFWGPLSVQVRRGV